MAVVFHWRPSEFSEIFRVNSFFCQVDQKLKMLVWFAIEYLLKD